MITMRRRSGPNTHDNDYELMIDGSVFSKEQADVQVVRDIDELSGYGFRVRVKTEGLTSQIYAQSFSDLSTNIITLEVESDEAPHNFIDEEGTVIIDGPTIYKYSDDNLGVSFSFAFDTEGWKGDWSIEEFATELNDALSSKWANEAVIHGNLSPVDGFNVTFPLKDPNTAIGKKVSESARAMSEILEIAKASLIEKVNTGTIVVHFNFPSEVKVACEQYLLYFVQFLEDLGVEATAELQHQAGQVLFSVTPADKDEALDNIRAALDTYLRLAASPVNTASVLSTEIEVQRLSANIQHLQGQLTLAHAVLQAKDAAIQLQQTTIAQQRQMLTGEIVLESMKDVTPKPKDSEEVLGGLAEITKYEGKGFNLNLPEVFRRLRQMFGDKKGKSGK